MLAAAHDMVAQMIDTSIVGEQTRNLYCQKQKTADGSLALRVDQEGLCGVSATGLPLLRGFSCVEAHDNGTPTGLRPKVIMFADRG
jgi:hypothetical protein